MDRLAINHGVPNAVLAFIYKFIYKWRIYWTANEDINLYIEPARDSRGDLWRF